MSLTRDQIVEAAIRVLDRDGPAALSMRRLGAELGAGAASLYWHVADRDELLDLVADSVVGEVFADVPQADTWQAWMEAFGRSLRRVLHRHPGAGASLGRRAIAGPNAMAALGDLGTLLAKDGFDPRSAALASTTLVALATALVLGESAPPPGDSAPHPGDAGRAGGAAVPEIPPAAGNLLAGAASLRADDRFDYGLRVLISGIGAQARGRPERRTAER